MQTAVRWVYKNAMMISVLFQTESHFPVKAKPIKEAVISYLTPLVRGDTEISIMIVGDRRMKQLNASYRNIHNTTDVLSFPQNDPSQPAAPFAEAPDGILRLGDVVVSYPQAVIEAASDNMLVDQKIIELIKHGIEHLLGHHHD